MSTWSRFRLAGLAVGLLLLGCSDKPPTAPTPMGMEELKALLAQMSPRGSSVPGSSWTLPSDFPLAMLPPLIDPASCAYSEASGFFKCPDTSTSGPPRDQSLRELFRFTRMYRLIDAAGRSQSKPDATTWAIEVKTTVEGTSTRLASQPHMILVQLDGQSDMTLSAIGTDKQTLNGQSITQLDQKLVYIDTTVEAKGPVTETAHGLVLPNLKAGRQFPVGIFSTVQPRGVDTGNTTIREMTYDGTNIATMRTVSDFGTMVCHVKIGDGPNPDGSCTLATP